MRLSLAICIILLIGAIFKLPIGYYTFLRISISIVSTIIIVQEVKNGFNFWVISFGLVLILFNPVIPIYLRDKTIWQTLDIITAFWFLIKTISLTNINKPNP